MGCIDESNGGVGVDVFASIGDGSRRAVEVARSGLDFLVRSQVTDAGSADCGRLAFIYDCEQARSLTLTTNWTTGVGVEALLVGYSFFKDARYLDAAKKAVSYLCSLQEFSPLSPWAYGGFHEETPQSPVFHPRDALTAAWALLDWSEATGDSKARERAVFYADWFVENGMDAGYPRWTVGFDSHDVAPRWYGSFHSGSAFFMARMFQLEGKASYLKAMQDILEVYNRLLLDDQGHVHVIADIERQAALSDEEVSADIAPVGWIRMHEYNDDFGALANLLAWQVTDERCYLEAAESFLKHMVSIQREDGGFGPCGAEGFSVPPAGGSVLLEFLAARSVGADLSLDESIERTVDYICGLQVSRPGHGSDGAFRGYTEDYALDPNIANIRTGGYAILALLRYAGARGSIYFTNETQADESLLPAAEFVGN